MERLVQLINGKQNHSKIIALLHNILQRNSIDDWAYSFDGYDDERQCLEHDGTGWKVYFGERGTKARCKSFSTLQEAGEELLRRLGQDEIQRAKMQSEFRNALLALAAVSSKPNSQIHSPSAEIEFISSKQVTVFYTRATQGNYVAPKIAQIPNTASREGDNSTVAACKLTCDTPTWKPVRGNMPKKTSKYKKAKSMKNAIREKMQG